jgi:ribonuclease P/MRP protein subunit RPP40
MQLSSATVTTNQTSAIEINLRLPSMFPGKKSFDRLIWAFKNVLDASLSWLFYDLRSPNLLQNGEAVPNALSPHAPTIKIVKPQPTSLKNALLPPFNSQSGDSDDETELLEWLSLAMARSPHVLQGDSIDPYLCRYKPSETSKPADLVLYQWQGFAPAAFAQTILLAAMKASARDGWFALGSEAFSGEGYMVLRDGGEVRTWRHTD